ncbi:MAG: cyclic GMP-AMP synthase DncV-like nucleotidyltransferase, partial [Thiohalomonadales bacterium]
MYDISPLLYKQAMNDRFFNAISITSDQEMMLRAARKLVRHAIRTAFRDARNYLENVEEKDIAWISLIKPKFMSQGSFVYKTLNSPCYSSQEIDLDDGVYLPMSIINSEPSANKDWFFVIIDGALE